MLKAFDDLDKYALRKGEERLIIGVRAVRDASAMMGLGEEK